MLDAWTLRVLVEVADRGSFSAAGEALSMTQPAVSRQIGGMERRVGVRLFQRVPRGVRPTAAGAIAVEQARDILARLHALEARLDTFTSMDTGQLRLSAFPSANWSFMPEAIRRFGDAHPGIALNLLQAHHAGPLTGVRDGTIDVALLTEWDLPKDPTAAKFDPAARSLGARSIDGVDLIPLLDEELLVALPVSHRLTGAVRVRLRDLRDEVWIEGAHPDCLGPIPDLTTALGGPPRIGFTCDDWGGKQALVFVGAGITLVPTLARTAMRDGVVLRSTSPSLPARRLYAAAVSPPFRPPAATAMLKILAAISAQPPAVTAVTG